MKIIFFLFIFMITFGCSKKKENPNLKYSLEEFVKLAHETSPNTDKTDDIKFQEYSEGVNRLESKALVYQRLTFFAVEFENEDEARKEALRLNQYYSRNWLFDRVEGEPVLEDYVIETFKAINPAKAVQRKPKAKVHGEGHGEAHEAGQDQAHEAPHH